MAHGLKIGLSLAMALFLADGVAAAAEDSHAHGGGFSAGHSVGHPATMPHVEPHPGPSGYKRITEPQGWDARPKTVDRTVYHHVYQAARSFKIGPYHRPVGWRAHRWVYGETLPRAYWASQYVLGDYWLFALEVPPVGYEWVRDGTDAILVDTSTGEILQVEYGVFA
jgi:Ni/Co efflux regulator RcnB